MENKTKILQYYAEDLYKLLDQAGDVLEHYDNDLMVEEMLRDIRRLFSAIQDQLEHQQNKGSLKDLCEVVKDRDLLNVKKETNNG